MIIADLHIHSKYSRATSADLVPESLDLWARRKGIGLVGTGDFTHPAWRAELREKLTETEDGLYVLRDGMGRTAPAGAQRPRFVVTGEISTIYKKDGKTRKVHSLILLPSLDAADELSRRLEAIGNIRSDGRPILGLDCRDLLEITLEACGSAVFIPAHIWTPHFSLFGAFSGFDRIEDCFGDLTGHIHALETGLSSDPPMNWRLSALDGYQLVSHSDAHSPSKLGREADLMDIDLSYAALKRALDTGEGLAGTLEFFPEEGKYHFDGHRDCHARLSPEEAAALGGRCPVCGKPITIGVLHRVEELADRAEGYRPEWAKPFESLAPLPEVIAAANGGGPAGKKTLALYETMLAGLGAELTILRETPLEDIRRVAGPCVEEGIRRLRAGEVERIPGYDGEFGAIRLLSEAERERLGGQVSLFGTEAAKGKKRAARTGKKKVGAAPTGEAAVAAPAPLLESLNAEQAAAATDPGRAVAVVAGPGTGKTKTLTARIAWLVRERGVKPGEITAVTFTNRAAGEMRLRLERELGGKKALRGMTIGTFHAICLDLLSARPGGARVAGAHETGAAAEEVLTRLGVKLPVGKFLREVSRRKNGLPPETELPQGAEEAYHARLRELGVLDFDDLLTQGLAWWNALEKRPDRRFRHLLVDEFQDGNAVQYGLALAWNRAGESLFVIGDPDQAIYGFRGAEARCFARLEEDFPDLRRVRLGKNYRSTPEIVSCALGAIAPNGGAARTLEAVRPGGGPVRVLSAESALSEGIFVAKEIGRQVGGIDMLDAAAGARTERAARSFDQFAVLCRTHRQTDLLVSCLRREGIPCVVAGRDDFLDQDHVRGALAFFQAMADPGDGLALRAALKLSFGCPADLAEGAAAVWAAAEGDAAARAAALAAACPGVGRLLPFFPLAEALAPRCAGERPVKLLEAYFAAMGGPEEPMERLLNTAVFYPGMPALLRGLALGEEGDLLRSAGASYEAGSVTVMTLHAAKGLEFPVVFLCGVNRGLIPYGSGRHGGDAAEERRLFYVGMTRAREELFLLAGPEPSPFLADLPVEGVERGRAAALRRAPGPAQISLF